MNLTIPLPISYPNVKFNRPSDGRWIEVIHIPNNRVQNVLWDAVPGIHTGLLRCLLHWNVNLGTISAKSVADEIAEHFAYGTRLRYDNVILEVSETPSVGEWIDAENETFVPVSIRYRTI